MNILQFYVELCKPSTIIFLKKLENSMPTKHISFCQTFFFIGEKKSLF